MNRSQFSTFIDAPLNLPTESSVLLEGVLKEFPYCQTAQLLFTKSLHNTNSIHYNNQLKVAAAFASDRTVLYNLITRKKNSSSEKTETDSFRKPITKTEEQILIELKIPETGTKVELTPKTELKKSVPSPQEILEERLKELEAFRIKTEEQARKKAEVQEKQEGKNLESSSKTTTKIIPESTRKVPVSVPEPTTEPVQTDDILKAGQDINKLNDEYISSAIDATIKIEIQQEIKEPTQTEEIIQEEEENELSFSGWLKRTGKTQTGKENSAKNTERSTEARTKEAELIDKFIKEEPKITKPTKAFYNPVNMARTSVTEDPEFVTETLAAIYAKQGNTSKAIKAYQTLSLKYPEKKLYFATLIEKMKGE